MSPEPIFIGGTGRCGTTVLGRLIGAHSDYAMIPFEVRFHADRGGVPDLLAGDVTLDEFLESMRTRWGWRSKNGQSIPKRFRKHVSEDQMENALEPFAASFPDDPLETSRRLVRSLLDPLARDEGKPAWVEMTPPNAHSGDTLAELFPGMRLVHIVRDGRDVASSVASVMERTRERKGRTSEPKSVDQLIRRRWERRIRMCEAGCANLSSDQLLVLQFEDLVVRRREESYARLLEFLELDDDPGMRTYFDTEMTADRAHIGRWRQGRSEAEQERIMDVYAKVLDGLRRDGVSCAAGYSTELEGSRSR
jgi:hypothetical protein